jgi:hypothetical protein
MNECDRMLRDPRRSRWRCIGWKSCCNARPKTGNDLADALVGRRIRRVEALAVDDPSATEQADAQDARRAFCSAPFIDISLTIRATPPIGPAAPFDRAVGEPHEDLVSGIRPARRRDLVDDVDAERDALVANVDCRPGHELRDLGLRLSAERAGERRLQGYASGSGFD